MDERPLSVERSTGLRDNPTFWSTSVGSSVLRFVVLSTGSEAAAQRHARRTETQHRQWRFALEPTDLALRAVESESAGWEAGQPASGQDGTRDENGRRVNLFAHITAAVLGAVKSCTNAEKYGADREPHGRKTDSDTGASPFRCGTANCSWNTTDIGQRMHGAMTTCCGRRSKAAAVGRHGWRAARLPRSRVSLRACAV
jgi:hypothetical protein